MKSKGYFHFKPTHKPCSKGLEFKLILPPLKLQKSLYKSNRMSMSLSGYDVCVCLFVPNHLTNR